MMKDEPYNVIFCTRAKFDGSKINDNSNMPQRTRPFPKNRFCRSLTVMPSCMVAAV